MEELDKKVSEIVRSTVKEFMESLMKGEMPNSVAGNVRQYLCSTISLFETPNGIISPR